MITAPLLSALYKDKRLRIGQLIPIHKTKSIKLLDFSQILNGPFRHETHHFTARHFHINTFFDNFTTDQLTEFAGYLQCRQNNRAQIPAGPCTCTECHRRLKWPDLCACLNLKLLALLLFYCAEELKVFFVRAKDGATFPN